VAHQARIFVLRRGEPRVQEPGGAGTSKLAKGAERHLHVDATARNWNTVTKLLEMVQGTD